MAGIDLDRQRTGTLPGGLRIQAGEYTSASDATIFVPTAFTRLFGGIAVGEITDPCVGYAASICAGPTIKINVSDATAGIVNYLVWGN